MKNWEKELKSFLREKRLIPETKLNSVWEYNLNGNIKNFIKKTILEILDDVIGEEQWIFKYELPDKLPSDIKPKLISKEKKAKIEGYNQKRQEIIDYKSRFK